MKPTKLPFLAVLAFAAACASPNRAYLVDLGDTVVSSRTADNGDKETFVVTRGSGGDAELRRVVESARSRPMLGVRTVELDKDAAQERGVKPYSGLLVKSVTRDGGAAEAGIVAGDVLLAADEQELVYQAQLTKLAGSLAPDQQVRIALLRGQDRIERTVRVTASPVEPSRVEHVIPLTESSYTVGPYAGVRLLGVPEPYNRELFGDGNGVVISRVELGSPAWVAGLRDGDLVESIDGGPVPPLEDLAHLIAERGEQRGEMQWQVTRGRGKSFATTFSLYDYRDGSDVHVPLLLNIDDGVAYDRWAVGPFGLVMSSRTSYVSPTPTRQAETRNEFSALLGLFCVDSGPRDTSVRLLWIIRFDT
ncbi:MAG: PDZ domain-containing protein [Planctomycetes bacterium]|nr:PDZ domain-containing protein [Planctomycetota bacterium]